jgi:hypothetical protein
MRFQALFALLLCLALCTACSESMPSAPTIPPDQQLTLAPGGSAPINGTSLTLGFVGVAADSRCPADALCIQGGDALVRIVVHGTTSADYELHTGDASRASALREGWRITLVGLQPYPFSSRTIQPEEYRATFAISE